jgi:hypothetical protein
LTGKRFTLLAGLYYHHVHSYYDPPRQRRAGCNLAQMDPLLALNPHRSHVTDMWVLRPVIRNQSRPPTEVKMNWLTKD